MQAHSSRTLLLTRLFPVSHAYCHGRSLGPSDDRTADPVADHEQAVETVEPIALTAVDGRRTVLAERRT